MNRKTYMHLLFSDSAVAVLEAKVNSYVGLEIIIKPYTKKTRVIYSDGSVEVINLFSQRNEHAVRAIKGRYSDRVFA